MPYKDKNKAKDNAKKYRENNKEKFKEYKKNYREKNLEKYKLQKIKDYENNKEYYQKYYIENKERLTKRMLEYKNERFKNDFLFRLSVSIRSLINQSTTRSGHKKNSKTEVILGCSFEEFKVYLESKFESWMNWDNKGLYNGEPNYGWDIDHIIPVSSGTTEDDVIRLNHYTNLKPLCSFDNRYVKRNRVVETTP